MLQIKNSTSLASSLMLLPDVSGVDTLFGVVKGTFDLGPRLTLADEQVPVTMADEHYGDASKTSIRAPSDVCLGKPGTDVVLIGSAWASDGRPTWQSDVTLSVGSASKTVRVFGDRVWNASAAGASIAWVSPFVQMPLTWERSYGGTDITEKGPRAEPRNPVGTGFRANGGSKRLGGMPLPNLEDPTALIGSAGDAPPPAAFAPVAPNWEPRTKYVGTYDDTWQRSRAPYLPADFDPRFFHFAPSSLAMQRLLGGEPVAIDGASPDGSLRFWLPRTSVTLTYRRDSGEDVRPCALETVIIEPDARRLVLVWRAALTCDKQALKIKEVEVGLHAS